jgi:lactoylglutathione lyase
VCFQVDDLDGAYERLIACGAVDVWGPRDSPEPGVRMAYVTDPDGNLIELVQPVQAGASR